MSISLLYLHLDLTSLYLRKRALWGQTEISLLSWCSACPGAVRLYVRHGGACGSEAGARVGVGALPTSLIYSAQTKNIWSSGDYITAISKIL